MSDPVAQVRGGLVVSVQATAVDDPMCDADVLTRVARAAVSAGAVGIRCGGIGGPEHVAAIRASVEVPVIGLTKAGDARGVRITPTAADAQFVIEAGAEMVAIDATSRPRPDGSSVEELIGLIHAARRLVVADIGTVAQAHEAASLGADLIATTLAGYLDGQIDARAPDLELLTTLVHELDVPIIAEGRYVTPALARRALDEGAHAVVVGSAITSPAFITTRFIDALVDGHRHKEEKTHGAS